MLKVDPHVFQTLTLKISSVRKGNKLHCELTVKTFQQIICMHRNFILYLARCLIFLVLTVERGLLILRYLDTIIYLNFRRYLAIGLLLIFSARSLNFNWTYISNITSNISRQVLACKIHYLIQFPN